MVDRNESVGAGVSRRRLLKTVAAGGSALGLTSLPGKWAKPTVASVILPAHAQTSGCLGTLGNCPSGDLFSTGSVGGGQATFVATALPPSVSVTGGSLTGVAHTSGTAVVGTCPSPCDAVEAQKYFSYGLSLGNLSVSLGVTSELLCGGDPVFRVTEQAIGTRSAVSGGEYTYSLSVSISVDACKYLADGLSTLTVSPLGLNSRFRFGR